MSESRHGMSIGNLSPSRRRYGSREEKYSMSVINITLSIMACSFLVLFVVKHQLSSEDVYYPKGAQPKLIELEPVNCKTISKASADKINKKFTENGSLNNGDRINGFWISIYSKEEDPGRWRIMTRGTYYERNLTRHFHEILSEERRNNDDDNDNIVIDIGMNIGWYSLLSASYNVSVISFEPNVMHHGRMCESLDLNGWDAENKAIELYPYGIGDRSGELILSYPKAQPGAGSISPKMKKRRDNENYVNQKVKMITLDDFSLTKNWFDTTDGRSSRRAARRRRRPNVAILKVDVESFEERVVNGASYFLHARLAKHIFCEVTIKPVQTRRGIVKAIVASLHQNGYYVKNILDWQGTPLEDTANRWMDEQSYPDPNGDTSEYAKDVKNLMFDAHANGYDKWFNIWFTRI